MVNQPHSQRFDELAVALPKHIDHPLLKQLATRLQADLLGTQSTQFCIRELSDGIDVEPIANKIASHLPSSQSVSDADNKMAESKLAASELAANNMAVSKNEGEIAQAHRILTQFYETPIAAASVLVAITNEPTPRLLLTRRASHLDAHAGEVSFAGGKYESTDGNNVVTALREACEETALPPRLVQLIGQLPIQTSKSGMSVRPIVALVSPELILVPELGEIARIFWADFTQLIKQPLTEYAIDYQHQGQSITLVTPSWQVDGETVWGLTGRIIASLLELGFDRQIDWYYRAQA